MLHCFDCTVPFTLPRGQSEFKRYGISFTFLAVIWFTICSRSLNPIIWEEMAKDEDFKLLKIQTIVLRVNIHCDGCKQKVKKLLQRIEGVYQVNIDAEQQKVTVSGGLDSGALIKKLLKAGKHAELWSQKSSQSQKQKGNCVKDDNKGSGGNKGQKQGLVKGLEALKNQQKFPFNLVDDGDCNDADGCQDDDEVDPDLRFLRTNQLNLLRQQAALMQANAKKGEMAANIAKMNNAGGKKGNGNGNGNNSQNMGMKANPGGFDERTMQALRMNNAPFGGANPNEGKKANDINALMNLAGFHGNGGNQLSAGGGMFHQTHPSGGMSTGLNHHLHPSAMMMNMNHPSSMLMNLQAMQQQQPQMMYNRSHHIPASTGYYYGGYGPTCTPPYDPSYYPGNGFGHPASSSTDVFNDDNTSSCAIM